MTCFQCDIQCILHMKSMGAFSSIAYHSGNVSVISVSLMHLHYHYLIIRSVLLLNILLSRFSHECYFYFQLHATVIPRDETHQFFNI